ncbi:xyloside xylosyltransferase 1-like [Myxocyprinus asiaticus]|uniref:xyloside xylosyltransferase 1-like n=1 Tax=Myxocyprinus asiaticus TaxID=70543 RepID=UPI0022218856|nr:xyloside xylosyltransferase 1-like [Myxocyprinus asiaticus]
MLLFAAALAVVAFCYFGSEKQIASEPQHQPEVVRHRGGPAETLQRGLWRILKQCHLPVCGTASYHACRHTFWQFCKENPKSRGGDLPPDGLPGFNSGVMLLDLDAMQRSTLYSQLLELDRVARLAEKYHFRGHLGDQDFFTMIGMEHGEVFYPLACGWNRQLCTWWREHGYRDVFQLYYCCDGLVHIYHGNCNTPMPDD